MGPVGGSEVVGGRAARRGAGRVVSRRFLFRRLDASARVTVISAPAGSGKTVLLRAWIGEADLAERTGWVSVERELRDPQRFWLAVADALRQTAPGSARVRPLTASPDLDGWAIVERLLKDLAPLQDQVCLVIDDLHELGPPETLRQTEVLRPRLRPGGLDRVNGPLADALTRGSGGEQILHELEEANAFVTSVDAARSWFRYHRLFADLLQLELRRTAPGEIPALHAAAADSYAQH